MRNVKWKLKGFVLLASLVMGSFGLYAQNQVSGQVTDAENGETLIGANVLIEGTVKGTVTDFDGNYDLSYSGDLPYQITISLIGYAAQTFEITEANQVINVALGEQAILGDEVVISASRVEENILQSPVSIEKIGLQEIKTTAAADFYDEINNLKGVTTTQASLTFNTINTRGFATAGNTRFVQLQDGIDNAAPLLNFPTGNIVGISELDIKSVELVPGAASALYGPNAFNGILFMNSKDPWNYQGLSAQVKAGVMQGPDETNPLYGGSFRWADQVSDRFAYKINFSTLQATDWAATDYDTHIVTYDTSVQPGDGGFDGVNLYGDETPIPVGTGLRRQGYREEDLVANRDATSTKIDGALHYRFTDNLEGNVSYKYGTGNGVYQGAERYALDNFVQQFAKVELNAPNWNIKAYGSFTDDGDSYNMSALGAFVNENTWHSIGERIYDLNVGGQTIQVPIPTGWAVAANLAYNGVFSITEGIVGSNANVAESFANLGGTSIVDPKNWPLIAANLGPALFSEAIPGLPASAYTELAMQVLQTAGGPAAPVAGTPEFDALVTQVREGLFQSGGAGFIDNSRMYHAEGNYDFSEQLDNVIGLQIGANVRQYSLFTDGTIFREYNNETMQNERITINEWGAYAQISKEFADNLKLTGSLRYDKNENFEGQFSPRVSAVYSLDENKRHNLRASFQTGFRNPTTQGQFIFFPASQVLLGGTESNASIVNELDGSIFNIYEDGALALDGETEVNLEYVKPERLTSYEIGYKGIIDGSLFLDVNYYHNTYEDFINQLSVLSTKDLMYRGNFYGEGGRWFPYTNVPITFSSDGIDMGMRLKVDKNWAISGNYSYGKVNFEQDSLVNTPFEGSNFDPGFNTPEHKFNVGLSAKNVLFKNFGLAANYRWQDDFFYSSSFGNGQIPSYSTLDASINYKIAGAKTLVKLGVTNLLNNNYVTNVGNPTIGRMAVLTITYDQFSN